MLTNRETFRNVKNGYIEKNFKVTNKEIKRYFNILQQQYKLDSIIELDLPMYNINDQYLICWVKIDPSKLSIKSADLVKKLEKYLPTDIKIGHNGLIYVKFFRPLILLKTFEIVGQVKNQKVPA
jgi:hypothetical protein